MQVSKRDLWKRLVKETYTDEKGPISETYIRDLVSDIGPFSSVYVSFTSLDTYTDEKGPISETYIRDLITDGSTDVDGTRPE